MLRIGRLLVACVPAEVTTTAGARLTRWIKETARSAASSDGDEHWEVIVTGLANGYAGYVTTPEEYVAQRYEGASTLYGQNTLGAYAQCLCELTKDVIIHSEGSELERVTPASTTDTAVDDTQATTERNGLQGGVPPLDLRWPPWKSFGAVLESNVGAREKDSDDRGCVYSEMTAGRDEVSATFLCGRPRRDTRPPPFGTYMLVERLRDPCRRGDELDESDVEDEWEIVATDDDLNTFVEYSSAGPCGFGSRLTLRWRPPENVPSGMYRVGVRGVAKGIRKFVKRESPGAYEGYSERFLVVRPTE
jgi:neutral ceramidase